MNKKTIPPKGKQKIIPLGALLAWAENLLLWSVFGALPPLFGFLTGWWLSVFRVPDERVIWFALGGLTLGVLVDLLWLPRVVHYAYSLPWSVPVFVYLFYSVGMLGFFMGVPVFNVLLGALAGFYSGRRIHHQKIEPQAGKRIVHGTALFAAGVLGLACAAALVIASCSASTPADIAGILGLTQKPTMGFILGISALTGIGLVVGEYWLARKAAEIAQ